MAMAMEAIFILAELDTAEAAECLSALSANPALDSEARCAAVWGLGVTGHCKPARVLPFIADTDDDVALHALVAAGQLPPKLLPKVAAMLAGTDREAASAAALLAQQGDAGIEIFLQVAAGTDRAAVWAASELGQLPEREVRRVSNKSLPHALARILAPMWAHSTSWLQQQQLDTPLHFMQRQTIRHLA